MGKLRKTWCADVMTSSVVLSHITVYLPDSNVGIRESPRPALQAHIWICRHPGLNMTGTALLRIPPLLRRPEAVWRPYRVERIHPHRVD